MEITSTIGRIGAPRGIRNVWKLTVQGNTGSLFNERITNVTPTGQSPIFGLDSGTEFYINVSVKATYKATVAQAEETTHRYRFGDNTNAGRYVDIQKEHLEAGECIDMPELEIVNSRTVFIDSAVNSFLISSVRRETDGGEGRTQCGETFELTVWLQIVTGGVTFIDPDGVLAPYSATIQEF